MGVSDKDDDSHQDPKSLDERLRSAKARHTGKGNKQAVSHEGLGVGMRIAVELAAAVLVGTVIGILIDRWLGTTPWFLIGFFILGCAAALRNVMRTAQELEQRAKDKRKAAGDPSGHGGDASDRDRKGQG